MLATAAAWATTYAKLLGVVAAVIVFGAWLVEHTAVERVKAFRDSLAEAERDQAENERYSRLESRVLEVYQVAAYARGYAAEGRARDNWTYKDELNRDVEMLERTGVARNFAYSFVGFAGRTESYLNSIRPPADLERRVRDAAGRVSALRAEADSLQDAYMAKQRGITGESINTDTITEEQARALGAIIRDYRSAVDSRFSPRLTNAANELFRSYDALFAYARQELQRREKRLRLYQRIQTGLFILGSVIALYASYLEARSKAAP